MKKTIIFLLILFCIVNFSFLPACFALEEENSSSKLSNDSSYPISPPDTSKTEDDNPVTEFSFYEWGLYGENGIGFSDDIDAFCQSEVIVGLLDSGIDGAHPDLKDCVYQSESSLHRDFTATDDKDGLPVETPTDDYGHGTFVAGIICGRGDGVTGVRGVCKKVKIISLKVLSSNGAFETPKVINAIEYAKKIGIKILNFSALSISSSREERDAFIKVLEDYNGAFICAAGNGGYDNDNRSQYPSNLSYDDDKVIAVAAIGKDGKRGVGWNYGLSSNYGKTSVTVFAPGSDIISAFPLDLDDKKEDTPVGYTYLNGTSAATPFVTGTIATLFSINPTLCYKDVKNIICASVKTTDFLKDLCVSSGVVNIKNAVNLINEKTF